MEVHQPLSAEEAATLLWLLRETFEPELLTPSSRLAAATPTEVCKPLKKAIVCKPLKKATATHLCH